METDAQKIYYALTLWANYIETGDMALGAVDADVQGKKFNALDPSQMKTVVRLRYLAEKSLSGDLQLSDKERRQQFEEQLFCLTETVTRFMRGDDAEARMRLEEEVRRSNSVLGRGPNTNRQ